MSNYEWLQSLSVEELAEVLTEDLINAPCSAEHCPNYGTDGTCGHYDDNLCTEAAVNWLNAEHEE